MRRGLSLALAFLLIVGVVVAIVLPKSKSSSSKHPHRALVTVSGVIGSDKEPLLSDPKVDRRLRELGLKVVFEKAGSRQIATSFDLSGKDFVWLSSDTAAQRVLSTHPGVAHTPVFYSPMAIATFSQITALLQRAGLARQDPSGNWLLDLHAYLAASQRDLRWTQIKGNVDYPVNKSVLVTTADVRTSNSGAMYLSLMTYVANHDNVVGQAESTRVLPQVLPLFLRQGFLSSTNDGSFNNYLVQGVGAAPMVLVYEAQFVERAALHDGSITKDMQLMYPSPTILTDHVMVQFTPGGTKLAKALTTDPQLRRLEVSHGFRTPDIAEFQRFTARQHLSLPRQVVNVIDAPAYETLEAMIKRIETAYAASNATVKTP